MWCEVKVVVELEWKQNHFSVETDMEMKFFPEEEQNTVA